MIITAGSATHFTCVEDAGAIIVTFVRPQLTDEDNLEQVGEVLFALVEKDAPANPSPAESLDALLK